MAVQKMRYHLTSVCILKYWWGAKQLTTFLILTQITKHGYNSKRESPKAMEDVDISNVYYYSLLVSKPTSSKPTSFP